MDINIDVPLITAIASMRRAWGGRLAGSLQLLDDNGGFSGETVGYLGDWVLTIDPFDPSPYETENMWFVVAYIPDPVDDDYYYSLYFQVWGASATPGPLISDMSEGFTFDTRTAWDDYPSWTGAWGFYRASIIDTPQSAYDITLVTLDSHQFDLGIPTVDDSVAPDWYLPAPTPSNDNFADAITLTGSSGSTTLTNAGSTHEIDEPFGFGGATDESAEIIPQGTVWYKWVAPASYHVSFDTFGSNAKANSPADSVINIWTGTSLTDLVNVAWGDDSNDIYGSYDVNVPDIYAAHCEFDAVEDETYYIQIRGYFNNAVSEFALNWQPAPVIIYVTNVAGASALAYEPAIPDATILADVATALATFLLPTVNIDVLVSAALATAINAKMYIGVVTVSAVIDSQVAWAFAATFLAPEINQIIPNIMTSNGSMLVPVISTTVTDSTSTSPITPPVQVAIGLMLVPTVTIEDASTGIKGWWVAS